MRIGRLAPFYRWVEYAAFSRALERRRFALLNRLSNAQRVLVLGEGDGRALERLLQVAPGAHFDVVESSPEMISLARRRVRETNRVTFFCRDARAAGWPEEMYDGIVTFFFLDCFDEEGVRVLVERLRSSLACGGVWLVSDFAIPDAGWRRGHAILWVQAMYWFFRITTGLRTESLAPIRRILGDAGMFPLAYESERAGLMFSSAWTQCG